MMPRAIDDQGGPLPGEEAPGLTEAVSDLYRQLGIESGWVLGVPEYIGGSLTPTLFLDWRRLPDLVNHHGDDATASAAPDWRRKRVTVTVRVAAYRECYRGETMDRLQTFPDESSQMQRRIHLATVIATSPPEWAGSLSFDGGLQISEPVTATVLI